MFGICGFSPLKNNSNIGFIWFFTHLFVPLHSIWTTSTIFTALFVRANTNNRISSIVLPMPANWLVLCRLSPIPMVVVC